MSDAKRLEQLHTLVELTALINSSLNTRDVRRLAIEAATNLTDAEAASLLLLDQESGELFFEVAVGEKGDKLKEIRLKRGQGIAGWVADRGEPVIIHDVANDARFFKDADKKSEFKTKNMICTPVISKGKTIGVLQAINKNDGTFDGEDLSMLSTLANQVAVAIENANLYQELKDAFYGTAEALAETIDKRDPYTGGHTKRVMEYSLAIGREMGLNAEEMERLKLAAILHDIGKIGVRDNVLLKEGKLDNEEFASMKQHPGYGSDILNHIRHLENVIPSVRGHHEKFDGTGYPDGASGEGIPLNARIIAVADTFDAMTSNRPYRKSLSTEAAISELKRCSGGQFDGRVVEAFLKAYAEMEALNEA